MRLLRYVLPLVLLLLSSTILADSNECEDLQGEDLTICQVCISIDDRRGRRQCLEVAGQLRDKQTDSEDVTESSDETEVFTEVVSESEDITTKSAPDTVESEPTLVVEPIHIESESKDLVEGGETPEEAEKKRRFLFFFERDIKNRQDRGISEKVFNAVYEIDPDSFSSTVVGIRFADYNEAVIALKNGVVLLAKRARQSRIEEGDVIVAKRRRGFGSKRNYILYGKGAGVDAIRVTCEHIDPTRLTVQRCAFASQKLEGW